MTNLQSGIDNIPQFSEEDVLQSKRDGMDYDLLTENGISRSHGTVPMEEFKAFLDSVDYERNFPSYVQSFSKAYLGSNKSANNTNRKFFEQFLSIWLTKPGPGDITADIAAANGPFSTIVKTLCGVQTSYHQDLNPANGKVHPYLDKADCKVIQIQCNATDLPFDDNEITHMYLLNSWEHFQAPSDLGFLIEAERCLKPEGQVLIVPLNSARQGFVMTDPALWENKQIYEAGKLPMFRKDVPVRVMKCGQVYAQNHDARLLVDFAAQTPKLRYEIVTIAPSEKQPWFPGGSWDVLIAHKLG